MNVETMWNYSGLCTWMSLHELHRRVGAISPWMAEEKEETQTATAARVEMLLARLPICCLPQSTREVFKTVARESVTKCR